MYKITALLAAVSVSLFAQSYTASVRGSVTDGSGAAVPGAKVTLTEADRNVPHTVATDDVGRYSATALPPGAYLMTVEAAGFKKHSLARFELLVQQQATVNVELQVGDLTTTVSVEGSAPLLNTTIASLGQVIDNKYMISLPNIGRNALSLAYLTPGVVGSAGRRGDTSTNFVANGSRNSTSDVMVDGVTVTTVEQNSGITDLKYTPSVDSVQEFKMQTNFFPAEYGQTGGAVVNVVTKSGTNDFHGTGFYFLRDDSFNANDWFANRAGNRRPDFRRNQLGGVLGGPVIKNKTFFFASFEGTRQQAPTNATATFPTDPQREGDFSRTFQANGTLISVYDPFATSTNAAGQLQRAAFPGNVIPKSRMDPVALKALAFFPRGNQVTNAVTNNNNWFAQGINASTNKQMDFKGDHNLNDKMRLTGRYSHARNNGNPANLFGEGNPAFTFNNGPTSTRTHSVVTDFTRTEGPSTVWTLRYGLIYSDFGRDAMAPFDLTSLGFPQYMKTNANYLVFPTIAPDGYTDIGTEGWVIMDRQEGVHQFSSSVSKFMGAHTLKFGGEFRQNFLDYLQPGYPSGRAAFGAQVTRELQNVGNNNQGNGLATMLLGWGTGGDYHIDPKVFSRSRYMGFHLQDDWKVTRKLTLNLGLRYEFDIPRWETQDRQSYWDLNAQSSVRVQGYDTRGVFRFVDSDRRSPFNGDFNNFSPRLGFAYAVNDKTSIRGAWGLLYQLSRATVFGHTGAAFNVNSTPTFSLDSNATLFAKLDNPYPQGMLLPPGRSLGENTFIGLGAGTIVPELNRNPEYYSWNFSIQRQVGSGVIEANYTGSRGAHLFLPNTSLSLLPLNVWYPGTPGAFTRDQLNASIPNPFFGQITNPLAVNMNRNTIQRFRTLRPMPQFDGTSSGTAEPPVASSYYHALQLKYEKRFSRGFTFLSHYVWSKMIDDASIGSGNYSWLGGSTAMQNPFNRRAEKSLSAHDIAHRVVISGAWQLPFGRGKKFGSSMSRLADILVGGWEVSGFGTFQSGNPLQISQNGGVLQNGTQRPNLVGDPSLSGPIVNRINNGYFNNAAFTQPLPDTFGSAPRYLNYRGPGIKTVDMALLKSVQVREGQRFEFRLEAVNVSNTPIFADPATAFGSSNFGNITGTKIGPRNVQLGFKYYF
ncbi:MAG: carboxypeptidase regulatory-like domain-containing protein [Bryobacterales bacterium]|nr:carboxypeptidase regulatory-like domain-containing protein [Bryobacterales bacterium]